MQLKHLMDTGERTMRQVMTALAATAFACGAAVFCVPAAHANLVANGNFGTGDFTDWAVSDPIGITIDSSSPYSGDTYDASLGTYGTTGTLSQVIGTTAGSSYTVSFELQNQDTTGSGDVLEAYFDGQLDYQWTLGSLSAGYNLISFIASASTSSTTLEFVEENDNSDWNLDDVSVDAIGVPEPPAAALLVGSLVGLGALRRRLRRG
jgi:hypothetical protein